MNSFLAISIRALLVSAVTKTELPALHKFDTNVDT